MVVLLIFLNCVFSIFIFTFLSQLISFYFPVDHFLHPCCSLFTPLFITFYISVDHFLHPCWPFFTPLLITFYTPVDHFLHPCWSLFISLLITFYIPFDHFIHSFALQIQNVHKIKLKPLLICKRLYKDR